MALAVHAEGTHARTVRLELDLRAPAPIGTFVRLEAHIERTDERTIQTSARALDDDGALVAEARAEFARVDAAAAG